MLARSYLLSFFKQIFSYAVTAGYLDKSPAVGLRINIPDDDEKGVPFTDSELALLWRHADDPTIEMLLILCYSGWRITEVFTLSIDLDKAFYTGGIKTQAGKNRAGPYPLRHTSACVPPDGAVRLPPAYDGAAVPPGDA